MKKDFKINPTTIFNPINSKEIKKLSIYKSKIKLFTNKTINMINVGRLVKQKNQIEILHALVKLKESIKNYRLLLVGDGPDKLYLQNFINKNKLRKFVQIIFVKNPYKFIKMSDVFILSSKFEGLPNVLLEAACLNKYIISSNCKTGPKEIIKEYKYGKLYKTGNSKKLYIELKQLNKNKLSSNTKNFSLNLTAFDAKKNLEKYSNAIKKLL
jgi:glycosyltransferase involved in cell wall biosynthesis